MLSPVYGDMSGFPPAILTTGTRDLLLSSTVRVHRKLRRAGVEAVLQVYEAQSHAQFMRDTSAPETKEAFEEIAQFFDQAPRKIGSTRGFGSAGNPEVTFFTTFYLAKLEARRGSSARPKTMPGSRFQRVPSAGCASRIAGCEDAIRCADLRAAGLTLPRTDRRSDLG
jgi:hypothetical protein